MSNSTLEYFKEYREKLAAINQIRAAIQEHEKAHAKFSIELMDLQHEIVSMQKIITVMIDKGWDPVEAKLRTENKERHNSLWNDSTREELALESFSNILNNYSSSNFMSQQLMSNQTGAIGNTYNCSAYSRPVGINGASGITE
jgi:hypothetical protein